MLTKNFKITQRKFQNYTKRYLKRKHPFNIKLSLPVVEILFVMV